METDAYSLAIYDTYEGWDVVYLSYDLADCYEEAGAWSNRPWQIYGPEGLVDKSEKTSDDADYSVALKKHG